ncbi:hypothetical protein [Clostridium botulinum]|uniref:hypothetical protein n=1 Tax=Clostridium botulinum TaxID=1491 RepID=UPI000361F13E|nr:hypothetical protein [Clostridium botulinum]MBY6930979.1 hypothetical protein [Clostridium botulinum]MBY6973048.1 hypothetical protein [Clostridium botulinum]
MQVILKKEEKPQVDEIFDFIKSLNMEEQKDFKSFIDGYKFAKQMEKGKRVN